MIEIFHDSVDISSSLISYNRQQEMCSGIGTLDLVIVDKDRNFFPWDFIELFEGGRKKGEYYVVSVDDDKDKGTLTISAQDGSKKLSDYFIDDQYTLESEQSARSLITKYLNMAGVSYEFTAGDGVSIGKGASFGMSSAFDAITTILQYSGWYMYFNPINTCIIGTLDTNPGSAKILTDSTITYIRIHKNDDMLRNKAVVWGGTEYPDGGMVHVSRQVITPWNYDENDLRTVVISNGMIRDYDSANTMVSRLMQEFPRLTIEKEINIAGTTTFSIGDSINVDSKWWKGSGLITTHAASFSAGDGFQTNIILDQRCPRLFGFWKEYPVPNGVDPDEVFDYVYIGTGGDGVWRKAINGHTWENYSEGLTDLVIKDLFVKDGIAACVGEEGDAFIRRENDGSWAKISYGPLEAYGLYYQEIELKVVACSIGSSTVVLGINYYPWALSFVEDLKCSFVVAIDYTSLEVKFSDQVDYVVEVEGEDPIEVWNILLHDVEVMGNDVIISTEGYAQSSAYKKDHHVTHHIKYIAGTRSPVNNETNAINTLIADGQHEHGYGNTFSFYSDSPFITDNDNNNIIYGFRLEYFYVGNLGEKKITTYRWSPPSAEWGTLTGGSIGMLRQVSETEFDLIVMVDRTNVYYTGTTDIFHARYTLGDASISNTLVGQTNGNPSHQAIIGNKFVCNFPAESCPEGMTCPSVFVYDLDSGSSEIVSNQINTRVWESYIAPVPQAPGPVGWVNIYQGLINFMIPGGDSVTIGSLYAIMTDYYVTWSWFSIGVFGGYHIHPTEHEIRGQYIKFTRSEDGSVSMSQAVDKHLLTFTGAVTPSIQLKDLETALGGGLAQIHYIDYAGVNRTNAHLISFDYEINLLASRSTGWKDHTGEGFYEDWMLHEIWNSDWFIQTAFGDQYPNMSSKYFKSKFPKRVQYKYPAEDNWITMHDLDLNHCKIPPDGTTSFGTPYYNLGSTYNMTYTITDDDNDGTVYFGASSAEGGATNMLLGIKIDGNSYSIPKEIYPFSGSIGTGMAIFGDWIAYWSSSYMRMTRGFSIGSPSKILKYTPLSTANKFIPLLDTGFNSTIEINKNAPIEAYHKPISGAMSSSFIYQNFTASTEDWSTITPTSAIYDLRTCDITNPSTFTIEEGSIGNENKWAIFGTKGMLKMFPTSLSGESVLVQTFEGNVSNIETTNFNGNPYLFVAVSGIVLEEESGGGFFQRGQNEVEFIEQSSGLPSAGITIIRVDDRL
jgi:hypothetical protein